MKRGIKMIQTIYEHYGLRPNEFMPVGKFEGFQYRDILYTIINVKQMEQDELNELYQMSQFFQLGFCFIQFGI